jgi:hypothetical protein
MLLDGIPAGQRYFAIRSFDAASNRSPLSNIAEAGIPEAADGRRQNP